MKNIFHNSTALDYIAEEVALDIISNKLKRNEIFNAKIEENNSKWSKFLKSCSNFKDEYVDKKFLGKVDDPSTIKFGPVTEIAIKDATLIITACVFGNIIKLEKDTDPQYAGIKKKFIDLILEGSPFENDFNKAIDKFLENIDDGIDYMNEVDETVGSVNQISNATKKLIQEKPTKEGGVMQKIKHIFFPVQIKFDNPLLEYGIVAFLENEEAKAELEINPIGETHYID